MVTLIVLAGVFALVLFLQKFFFGKVNIGSAGRIAMSSMLLFTGIGHFIYMEGMKMMLPALIPFKQEVIILTGVLEIVAAITLLIPRFQKLTSILLIIFFIALLAGNIHSVLNHVNLQRADFTGKGTRYLWFRVPLQLMFIAWVWYFGYRDSKSKE